MQLEDICQRETDQLELGEHDPLDRFGEGRPLAHQ